MKTAIFDFHGPLEICCSADEGRERTFTLYATQEAVLGGLGARYADRRVLLALPCVLFVCLKRFDAEINEMPEMPAPK